MQDAAARLVKVDRDSSKSPRTLFASDREKARLVQRRASGNEIVFGFAQTTFTPDEEALLQLHLRDVERAELAMRKLVSSLPAFPQDQESVQAILGAEPALRLAVRDIAEATRNSDTTVGIDLYRALGDDPDTDDKSAILTYSQARELSDELGKVREISSPMRQTGRLDGERIRRRIFYLDLADGREISGAINEDKVHAVRLLLDQQVDVTLEVTQTVTATGQAGRRHYRLTNVEPVEGLFDV